MPQPTNTQDALAAPTRRSAFTQGLLAGLAHSLLLLLAFPPLQLWPFAFLAPIPLLWLASRKPHLRWPNAMLGLFLGTFPYWFYQHLWLLTENVAPFGPFGVAALQSIYPPLTVALIARCMHTPRLTRVWPFLAACAWILIELLRGQILFTGYPWFLAAHPLIDVPALTTPAAVGGAYLVSFLLVWLVAAIYRIITSPPPRTNAVMAAAIPFLTWAALSWLGAASIPPASDTIRVCLVQTNLAQRNKLSLGMTPEQHLRQLFRAFDAAARATLDAAATTPPPDLIVWPETMVPGFGINDKALAAYRNWEDNIGQTDLLMLTGFASRTRTLQSAAGVPLLVGAIAETDFPADHTDTNRAPDPAHRYNAAILFTDDGTQTGRYDKVSLMAFGERLPYIDAWPWLRNIVLTYAAQGMPFDLSPGASTTPLIVPRASAPPVAVATPICYEVTNASHCRRLTHAGNTRTAQLLINLSNDGWFGSWDPGRNVHLTSARWRCVELGLPMARAVNTGITCTIDPTGKVTRSNPDGREVQPHTHGVLTRPLGIPSLAARPTPFATLGHTLPWSLASLALLAWLWSLLEPRLSNARSSGEPAT